MGNTSPQNIESFNPDLKAVLTEEEEGHYLFVIADRKKALIFLFNKGKIEDSIEIMHPGVKKLIKSDSGELYGRNDKLSRHIDKQIHEHLQFIVSELEIFIKGININGVFIGGHKPFHNTIKNELPKNLQEKVRANFVTELNISQEDLKNHCILVLNEYLK